MLKQTLNLHSFFLRKTQKNPNKKYLWPIWLPLPFLSLLEKACKFCEAPEDRWYNPSKATTRHAALS